MKEINVKWSGIRPLIMHNAAMIDPDNEFVRRKNELQRQMKKLKKDDVDGREKMRREIERVEWRGSLYWAPTMGVYMPGKNIMACIVAGARKLKSGKQAEQAIIPIDDVPVETTVQTKDLDILYNDKDFSLREAVRIPPKTGTRVMAVRPKITKWTLRFKIEFDEKVLPTADLIEANTEAGSLIGIGDWRPVFGRFLVNIEE